MSILYEVIFKQHEARKQYNAVKPVMKSTGLFVFLYAPFYYFKMSNMSGALQTIEYFGYTFLTCYVFFLMLGTVSFFASLHFVRYIYVNLKMD
uniref:Transmembrane 9 superfamily member n=1 Tax=Magallana gigas TaxID=29159 RepID=K1Q9X7_MAGGI